MFFLLFHSYDWVVGQAQDVYAPQKDILKMSQTQANICNDVHIVAYKAMCRV